MKMRLVGINERGRRVGEDHPRARLTDADVERMRRLHEDVQEPLGYRRLTRVFECSITLVKKICRYEIRTQTPTTWRKTG